VVVQTDAEYPGMPRAALQVGAADLTVLQDAAEEARRAAGAALRQSEEQQTLLLKQTRTGSAQRA
jgi:hypothetical protein